MPGFGLRVVEQLLKSPKPLSEFGQRMREATWRGLLHGMLREIVWICAAPARSFT